MAGARSSPLEDSEFWAGVLADPLEVGMSCSSPPEIHATYLDHDTMDIQLLLEGPQDEYDLERWLVEEGAIRSSKAEEQLYLRHQQWKQLRSPSTMKEVSLTHEAVPATQTEKEGTCAVSAVDLLDYVPRSDWRHGCRRRGHRKRRTSLSTLQMLLRNHFGNAACLQDMPSASKGLRHGLRRNNEHWTLQEITKLVDGIEEYGVGQWTQLKEGKFPTTVRRAVHIKDKWRNILKSYTVSPTSKKKGNATGRFLVPLDETLIKRIKKLAAEHPYPKSRRTSE